MRRDTLEIALFYGDGRAKVTEALLDHDVVLTTYRTLAFDWKGRRVLQTLEWFRIVLDEGKLIALKQHTYGRDRCLGMPLQSLIANGSHSALDPKPTF